MGKDFFDFLNSAEDSVVNAACQLGMIGAGEDAEFQASVADVLNRLGRMLGLVGGFRVPQPPTLIIGENTRGMSAVIDALNENVRQCREITESIEVGPMGVTRVKVRKFHENRPLPNLWGAFGPGPSP